MSVEAYETLIAAAKEEIQKCRDLINTINTIEERMINCATQLEKVSNNLEQGLVIDGIGQGSTIADKAAQIKNFKSNMVTSIDLIKARISELESNITKWESEKKSLIAYLLSLAESAKKFFTGE